MTLAEPIATTICALSEAEAAARRAQGLGNRFATPSSRSYRDILHENLLTVINGILFGLGLALVLIGRPADAVVTVGVISFNILVSVVQEVRAKRKLDQIALLHRPTATVLRDGNERAIDPAEIVVGDVLVVGPGDQIVVDGVIVGDGRIDVDESLLTGESEAVPKRAGDRVFSGTFCLGGRAAYEARAVGAQAVANQLTAGARSFRRVLTPLQRSLDTVLRAILLLAIYLGVILVIFATFGKLPLVDTVQRLVVIAGLVPNGLLLAIAVAYALAAVRLINEGILVQQSNAVESLSNVDVFCLDKTGTLTANRLSLRGLHPLEADEATLRRLLGSYAASGAAANATAAAIGAGCPGQPLPVVKEVPFGSAHKWSALTFTSGAPEPTYVLGAPEALRPFLRHGADAGTEQAEAWAREGLRVLLFASYAASTRLLDSQERPQLAPGLRPLGLVALADELRAGARETLAGFREAGVEIKIISGDNPETVAALARQAGLPEDARLIAGGQLDGLGEDEFRRAVREATVFGRITPQQKERIVRTLREQGRYVAMTGDGVNDVLSLKQAQLGVAMASGSQATRAVADLILLNDSFTSLPRAVKEGQRVVNGMADILKIFLTRIANVALLIVMVPTGFPFNPREAALMALLTVGIPSLGLAAWARPGPTEVRLLFRRLVEFIVPAVLTASTVGLLVYTATYVLYPEFVTGGDESLITPELLSQSERLAQAALTAFVTLCGLLLLLFVEPPTRFFAVLKPAAGEWRPTVLAALLGAAFLVLQSTPWGRQAFDLAVLPPFSLALLGALSLVWVLVVRLFWRGRLLQRALGLPSGSTGKE